MPFPNPFDLRHHRSGPDGDLVERFLSTYNSRQTRRNYRTDLRQFFGGEGITRQVASKIEEDDIAEFLRERVDSLKRSTLERKTETVRSFFRWIADQNLIEGLPISEGMDTGDVIDQVLQEAHETTEGEGKEDSRTSERSAREDEGNSERSCRGPVPMKLEPGSELNLYEVNPGSEMDSGFENSSSADSPPEVGAGTEATPGSEDTESPPSEAPSREEPRGVESSSDSSTGSDPDEEGPPKEESVEERDVREEPIGEGQSDENSADDDTTGENSDGEDQSSLPEWAFASGEAKEIDLHRGEHVALADLPDAIRGALLQLRNPSGPEGLFIRCTSNLKVQIRSRRGKDSSLIEVTIEHRSLRRILRNRGDLSVEPTLRQAIFYLHDLDWALPTSVYDLIDGLPDPADAEVPLSEERPRWRQESTGDGLVDAFLAAQITGVLTEGFGIEKDEEVFVGI